MQTDDEVTLTLYEGRYYMTGAGGLLRELPFGTVARMLPDGRVVARIPRTIHNQIPDTRTAPPVVLVNPDGTMGAGLVMGGVDGADQSNTYPEPAPNPPLVSAATQTMRYAVPPGAPSTRPPGDSPLERKTAVRVAVRNYLRRTGRRLNEEELTAFIRANRELVIRIITERSGAGAA
jgi:hypothetical protein